MGWVYLHDEVFDVFGHLLLFVHLVNAELQMGVAFLEVHNLSGHVRPGRGSHRAR